MLATFPIGPIQTNCYLLHGAEQAVAVDVGGDPAPMTDYLTEHGLSLAAILITHRHFDHLYGVAALEQATGVTAFLPEKDGVIANSEASMGGIWGFPRVKPFTSTNVPLGPATFGGMNCTVLETPGHTPGSVSYYFPDEKIVFSGDTLFYRSVGRSDFPGGDGEQLVHAIRTVLFSLPDDTRVLPGHGPETTIGYEREHNPYCGDFVG